MSTFSTNNNNSLMKREVFIYLSVNPSENPRNYTNMY